MKKFLILSLTLVMVLLSSVSVFAGDIPESLLYEDTAQVFWGTVKTISSEDGEVKVEVSCDQILKGEVNETEVYTNPNNIGGFEITVGNTYLVTSFDRKEPSFYETTSQDTKTLELKNIDGIDIWERMEKALNDGLFEQAEQRRIEKQNTSQSGVDTLAETQTSDTDTAPQIDMEEDHQDFISQSFIKYIVAGAAVVVLILGTILIIKRKSK